jgi:hypothetical protein
MNPGLGAAERYLTPDEKREVLEQSAPKIVDERKYYGSAVTDFRSIKQNMKRLGID